MSRLEGKTYFVCVGAQKAGTTWLYDYLYSREDFYLPRIKEMHFFNLLCQDERDREKPNRFEAKLISQFPFDYAGATNGRKVRLLELLDRVKMSADKSLYRRFFEDRVPPEATHFGEITPAYSTMPAEGYSEILAMFPDAKFIFIMRDPVERYYSALRMRQGKREGFDPFKVFEAKLHDTGFHARSRYDITIENLRATVKSDNIFFGFYETLFSESEIRRLCGTLGVKYKEAAFERRVHSSVPGSKLPPSLAAAARKEFDSVYQYCAREFGNALPAQWMV